MNKRDREGRFRVQEASPEGAETYFAYGWEIADKARIHGIMKPDGVYTLPHRASLRTCMKAIAVAKNLYWVSTERKYIHQIGYGVRKDGSQGKARRFERLADPITVYGNRSKP